MKKLKVNNKTWNLTSLLKDDNDPKQTQEQEIIDKNVNNFCEKWQKENNYLKDTTKLLEALNDYEKLMENPGIYGDAGYYFYLRSQQNQKNPEIISKMNKIQEKAVENFNKIQFFTLNLGKVSEELQKNILSDKKFTNYHNFLKKIFDQTKFQLSEKEEKILKLMGKTSRGNWIQMTQRLLSSEGKKLKNEEGKFETKYLSDLLSLLSNKNKKIRDDAAKALNEILEKYSHVAESEINSVLEHHKNIMKLRGFKRADEPRLLEERIDTEIIDNLIEIVAKNFTISKEYYEIKAKLLNQKKLEYHERNLSYGDLEQNYTYEEALNLVYKVFSDLDNEFAEVLESISNNGFIDIYPAKDRSGSQFCTEGEKNQPVFIFLNFTGKLNDILTLAHESGHAINHMFIKQKQNTLNLDNPLCLAEVSSTLMEDFVVDELLKNADDKMKLSLLIQRMDDYVSTIIRQIACYKFELELHEKFASEGYLSKERIGEIFQKHMKAYMGDFVEQSPGAQNWWIYWNHIRYFFYVFSYSSGLLISKSIQAMIKRDKNFVKEVKEFLSVGGSKSPYDAFLSIGIDIKNKNFWQKGLDEMKDTLDEIKKLAKKMSLI